MEIVTYFFRQVLVTVRWIDLVALAFRVGDDLGKFTEEKAAETESRDDTARYEAFTLRQMTPTGSQ